MPTNKHPLKQLDRFTGFDQERRPLGSCPLPYNLTAAPHQPQFNENWKSGGHKHYLDWYFKEWLGDSKPTERETQLLRFLKRSGFVELQKG
jgi:hypothetical protein